MAIFLLTLFLIIMKPRGMNLGLNIFPLGSPAILMWLNTMRQSGMNIRLVDYLKVDVVLSILEVLSVSLILWLEINVFHFTLATRLF